MCTIYVITSHFFRRILCCLLLLSLVYPLSGEYDVIYSNGFQMISNSSNPVIHSCRKIHDSSCSYCTYGHFGELPGAKTRKVRVFHFAPLRKLYDTMLAASAIFLPIRDVSIDYKDDTSVSSTARTVKASNHDPQLLAQGKKVRTENRRHLLHPDISPLYFETCRFKIAVS